MDMDIIKQFMKGDRIGYWGLNSQDIYNMVPDLALCIDLYLDLANEQILMKSVKTKGGLTSQSHYPSSFKHQNVTYNCAGQFTMVPIFSRGNNLYINHARIVSKSNLKQLESQLKISKEKSGKPSHRIYVLLVFWQSFHKMRTINPC